MKLKWIFAPRETDFLKLLANQAQKTLEGMEALEEFMRTSKPEFAKKVKQLENEEDELRRVLIDELNKSFSTPIDREDIFSLSRAIDDVLDYGNTTVDEMMLLGVKPNAHLREMVSILRSAAEEIYNAVLQLKKRPAIANEHAVKAKALENQMENIYRRALVDLFEGKNVVSVSMLKLRECYRHLSNAADRGDEAANIIGDIIVKMA